MVRGSPRVGRGLRVWRATPWCVVAVVMAAYRWATAHVGCTGGVCAPRNPDSCAHRGRCWHPSDGAHDANHHRCGRVNGGSTPSGGPADRCDNAHPSLQSRRWAPMAQSPDDLAAARRVGRNTVSTGSTPRAVGSRVVPATPWFGGAGRPAGLALRQPQREIGAMGQNTAWSPPSRPRATARRAHSAPAEQR